MPLQKATSRSTSPPNFGIDVGNVKLGIRIVFLCVPVVLLEEDVSLPTASGKLAFAISL